MGLSDQFADSDAEFIYLIEQARRGSEEAMTLLLEHCRPYLLLIANREIDVGIRAKVGASDIVQESLLTAQRAIEDFHGRSESDLLAWLRGILVNDLRDVRRRYAGTEKRDINKERPIAGDSAAGWPSINVLDGHLTPRADAIANEEMIALRKALDQLPGDYRKVIQLRNWQQLTFAEIGKRMERSSEASRKLWSRAIVELQMLLESDAAPGGAERT